MRRVISSGPAAFSGSRRIVTSRLLSLGSCACAAKPIADKSAALAIAPIMRFVCADIFVLILSRR